MATETQPPESTARLAEALDNAIGRELGARTGQHQQAIADRLGLSLTDLKCLALATRAGAKEPLTAGKLADVTGLTTGAITGVLDRLERARFIQREKDPKDRRAVYIRVLPERMDELAAVFQPLLESLSELYARYTPEELTVVRDFLLRVEGLLDLHTTRLREEVRAGAGAPVLEPGGPSSFSAPLDAEVSRGELEFSRGASHLELAITAGKVLYRAEFQGAAPEVNHDGGRVVIAYSRAPFWLLDWRRQTARVELNGSIPWRVRIRGGVSNLRADLRGGLVSAVEIEGGASDLLLDLPQPVGTVPLSLRGGGSTVKLFRPSSAPIRARIRGGASNLTIDTLHLGAVGGETRWESPEFASAVDRYEIDITGGTSNLTVAGRP